MEQLPCFLSFLHQNTKWLPPVPGLLVWSCRGVNVLMDVSDLHADDLVAMATFSFTGKKAHLLS